MAGTLCNFATQLKFIFGYDDCLDVREYISRITVTIHSDAADFAPVDLRVAYYWRYCGECTFIIYISLISQLMLRPPLPLTTWTVSFIPPTIYF
jgi:hypothetical protein